MRSMAARDAPARLNRACANSRRCWKRRTNLPRYFRFMPTKVRIPTPLRKLTNNEEIIEVNATTIGAAISELQARYPGIKERLVDETGAVRRFVNVYVNEEDIRFLQNQQTPLKDGDEVSIIPAIA